MPEPHHQPENEPIGLEDDETFEASLVSDSLTPEDTARVESAEPVSRPEASPPRVEPPRSQPRWIGKRMGRFKLLSLLGEGSMGRVVQAMDVNLRRIVALKILRKRVTGIQQERGVEQFLREARAAAAIEHPNIVRVYEINEHAGWWYIAMEMVEGGTLRDMVKAAGPLPIVRAGPLIADAALALVVAHQRGVIHRDIKPNNLMITRDGRCKISDFGLVRYEDPNDPFDFTDKSVGTPRYMAPEVIRQEPPTSAIDVYSLGATLYFALTGASPYDGQTLSEICQKHLHAAPPDLRQVIPEAPASLAQLIQRMLAKDPADRPTPADVASMLRAEVIELRPDASGSYVGLAGSSIVRTPPTADADEQAPPTRIFSYRDKRRRLMWVGASVVVVCVAAATAVLISRRGPEPRDPSTFYPQAPASYGLREPGQVPSSADPPQQAPPFSWVGQVQPPAGARFVAVRYGQHYWPIDAPAARLIRADQAVFFTTADQAAAAGLHPAD